MKQLRFFTDIYDEKESDVVVFGVDYTKDSAKALKMIRKASLFVEPLDAEKQKDLIKLVKIFDKGNIKVKKMEDISKTFESIRKAGKVPFMFSRGHLASYYTTKTLDDETKLVVFDAHADMKDEYIDELIKWDVPVGKTDKKKMNGSTWLRRLSEIYNPRHIMIIGLRSFDEDELEYMKNRGILFYTSYEIKKRLNEVSLVLREFTKLSDVYISLDVDVFDPSIAPAVDYPEPDGLSFLEFKTLMSSIAGKLVGADIACFKPINDNMITEFLIVKAAFQIISKLS